MAKRKQRQGKDMYRVSHNGANERLVSGADPKHAAERYVKDHGATGGGFVCVRDGDGREKRFLLRVRKRKETAK